MNKEMDRVDAVLHIRATSAATYYHTVRCVPLDKFRDLIKDDMLIGYKIIKDCRK